MKISIVTPTYNSAKTVLQTVRSVLEQDYPSIEHWIIDNQSQDATVALVREEYERKGMSGCLKIRSEKDRGISDAFNRGIESATGEVVAILNSDDSYTDPGVLSRVARIFLDPEVQIVHGNLFFEDDRHGSNIRRPMLCPVTRAMPFNHPTMFVRKSAYDRFGLFSLSYRYAMDFEWVCRLYETPDRLKTKVVYLDGEPLARMSAGGASYTNELKSLSEVSRALEAHGFWGNDSKWAMVLRTLRVCLKSGFSLLGFGFVVVLWRRWKWGR